MRHGKHVPQRTCIVCRRVGGKRELLRLVRTPDGDVLLDETGKAPGRGAYLCPTEECIEKITKKKAVERALKAKTTADALERLRSEAVRRLEQNPGLPGSNSVQHGEPVEPQTVASRDEDSSGPRGGVA